ncbi:MAG: DUF6607 family protein [Pseudomonadota bacterium]
MKSPTLAAILCSAALLSACATTYGSTENAPSSRIVAATPAEAAKFEQDRQAILAMAGNHRVKFDFRETVAFADGYAPKDPYLSGGDEVVMVIEDRGEFISLQHILVVGGDEKFPVKHWRQDWRYEPTEVLTFVGGNAWEMRPVAPGDAKGKWSQTVYQVDDSPRYGAVGAWSHDAGASQWTPPAEWRPLPRRDMTTRDDYHAVDAVNVHAITPDGWVHEQNNLKVALRGAPQALVREIGVNTYKKFDDFDVSVATSYWDGTKDYWAAVRDIWSSLETPGSTFAITVKGETTDLYSPLMAYAEEVKSGEKTLDQAIAAAREDIATYTTTTPDPLQSRLRPATPKTDY